METKIALSILLDKLRSAIHPSLVLEPNFVFFPPPAQARTHTPVLTDFSIFKPGAKFPICVIQIDRPGEQPHESSARVESEKTLFSSIGTHYQNYKSIEALDDVEVIRIANLVDSSVDDSKDHTTVSDKAKSKPLSFSKIFALILIAPLITFYTITRVQAYIKSNDPEAQSVSDAEEQEEAIGILLPDSTNETIAKTPDTPKFTPDSTQVKKTACQPSPPINGTMKVYSSDLPKTENSFWTFINQSKLHGYVWLSYNERRVAEFYIAPQQKYTFQTPAAPMKYDATLAETWCSTELISDPTKYQMRRFTFATLGSIGPNTHATTYLTMHNFNVESSSQVDKIELPQ